ncbi:MAG: phospho-N-acetylmuramoyl-pentapeptide-transferase [Candidatus Berkelbacteria bacterium]
MEFFEINSGTLIRLFGMATLSFMIAFFWTPLLTDFLYKNKLGKTIRDAKSAPIMAALHAKKAGTPTMGGILIWVTVAILTLLFNFSRSGTWLVLFCLIATGIVGLVDDYLNVKGIGEKGGGLTFRQKFPVYAAIAAVGAWWFYSKLGWNSIHLPGIGDFTIGLWYVPLFIVTLVWVAFASNETDGLDGLAGGIFAFSYGAYGLLALVEGREPLAIFCATVMGALLAFLWFNIPPARFFMGDTGSMALGMTLAVIAFQTNAVVVLPLVTLVFTLEGLSFIIQMLSKKFRNGKKIFLSSPFHHHLEAIGWPEGKIVMRFWIISAISSVAGLAIALVGRGTI